MPLIAGNSRPDNQQQRKNLFNDYQYTQLLSGNKAHRPMTVGRYSLNSMGT